MHFGTRNSGLIFGAIAGLLTSALGLALANHSYVDKTLSTAAVDGGTDRAGSRVRLP